MQDVKETTFARECKNHLKKNVERKMKGIMSGVLDLIEVCYPNDENRFKTIRGKILSVINDEKRDLMTEIDSYVIFKKLYHTELPFGKEKDNG